MRKKKPFKVKEELEMTPSDIKLLMKNWKPSIKKKTKESFYERVRAGMDMGKKARNIF